MGEAFSPREGFNGKLENTAYRRGQGVEYLFIGGTRAFPLSSIGEGKICMVVTCESEGKTAITL